MRLLPVLFVACSSPSPPAPRESTAIIDALVDAPRWLAGDLHMHVSPPDDPHDVALSLADIADAAVRAGMDFVVLTPHVWSERSDWQRPWRAMAAEAERVQRPTLIPGVEWTTRQGHFTVTGADLAALDDDHFLDAAHAAGAYISVNHPFAVPTKIHGVAASHYDMSYRVWTQRRPGFSALDGAEVWNVPLALANILSRPGGLTGEQRAWAELDRIAHAEHRRVTAVGGTDNHAYNVAPTTWVLAADASAAAILAALRAGATCIGGPEAGTLRAKGDAGWVAIGGAVRGPTMTLAWAGTARVFVDEIDQGEHDGAFTHETGGELHTYRIEIGRSRSGYVYANL